MELLLWGFISLYIEQTNLVGFNAVTVLLGAIILWDLLSQSQNAVSIAFLEDVWEKNFLNLFVTPLRISEFLTSSVLVGLVRAILVGIIMSVLAVIFYQFNILRLGLALVPFLINLLLFGWLLGFFTIAFILRFGTSAQVLAFGLIFLIQPFSAVFYPVSAIPESIRWIAYLLPSTYVSEGMRTVIAGGAFPVREFFLGLGANSIYGAFMIFFFYRMFAYVKRLGLLMKLD
jgi:ABC-2 type transport system permease protein